MSFPPKICGGEGDDLVEVEAVVEEAIAITITVALRQLLRLRCTTINHHHIVMGAVAALMIIRTVLLPRTLLGHLNNINTGKEGTADPAHTHHSPRTVEILTRMAVGETLHGRCLVRTAGADINLDSRAEVDTVEVVGDTIMAAIVGVVMVMEAAVEDLTILRNIRAGTIQAGTMVDIAQAAEAHREDAVEAEATELWSSILVATFSLTFFICFCLYMPWFCTLRDQSEVRFRPTCAFIQIPGYFSLQYAEYKFQLHGFLVFVIKKKVEV